MTYHVLNKLTKPVKSGIIKPLFLRGEKMNKKILKILLIITLMLPITIYAEEITNSSEATLPIISFGESMTCAELLGPTLTKVLKIAISALRIFAVIYAIVSGMLHLLPAIYSSDAHALNKQTIIIVKMLVILVLVILLPTIVEFIGELFGYDLSCFI